MNADLIADTPISEILPLWLRIAAPAAFIALFLWWGITKDDWKR